jgi:triacylglycerol lipase
MEIGTAPFPDKKERGMNLLGLVGTGPSPAAVTPGLQWHIQHVLAGSRRLWLRSHLAGLPPVSAKRKRWWHRESGQPTPPVVAHFQTHISGKLLQSDVPIGPQGEIDVALDADLPPARRGWRVARNRLEINGQTLEACSVVGLPPHDAAGVAVVVLPRAQTLAPGGASLLERTCAHRHLADLLHRLHRGPRGGHMLCYLACVPPDTVEAANELALAVASLGWPHGTFLPLPISAAGADGAILTALDRLRWLFAGEMPVQLVNLDPAAGRLLEQVPATAPDRAEVRQVDTEPAGGHRHLVPDATYHCRRPTRGGLLTRYPIVFCHGMLACSMLRMRLEEKCNYFAIMQEFLEERGFRVLFPQVTPTGGVVQRAAQLGEQVRRWTREPVNLIAHSMGGLDARYLITHLGMAGQVKSLTTIATPHRGTCVADWFQANYRRRVPLLLALEAVGINVDGFRDCQLAACRDFNSCTPDVPGVRYFSYAGAIPHARVTPILRRSWVMLDAAEGPNDGLVSVTSARWGEYLGTIYADHFAQTPDGLFLHPAESFDSLGFFSRLVEDLARRGF